MTDQLKIAQVIENTGLSKELIHSYLRQGLLPRSKSRAKYDQRQLRLLILIKKLREEHNLPLEIIRGLFEVFRFNPDELEPLVMVESLSHRLAELAEGRSVDMGQTLDTEELTAATGVSTDRIEEYVKHRFVSPWKVGEKRRFSQHDVNTIKLCERGILLGVSFEAFRTVASYIRIAFELQWSEIFSLDDDVFSSGTGAMSRIFLRREVVASFVQNVYSALVQRALHQTLERPVHPRHGLDSIVYKPSSVFIERYRLEEQLAAISEAASRSPDSVRLWRQAGQLHLHAGRYREAAFLLEKALERWPTEPLLRSHYGIALVLSGESERGQAVLEELEASPNASSLNRVYLALSLLEGGQGDASTPSLTTHNWARIRSLIDRSEVTTNLDVTNKVDPLQFQVRLFGAWILTVLPPVFRQLGRGRRLLIDALAELDSAPCHQHRTEYFPGLHDRYRINAAYLLFECLTRSQDQQNPETPTLEELRRCICRLDPASNFARTVFLSPH